MNITKPKHWTFLILLLIGVVSVACTSEDPKTEGIQFEHSKLEEVKAKAAAEGKMIFVDAYTTWCGPCKFMSKKIFTLDEVGTYFNENFVSVKIDMEGPEGRFMENTYSINAYPTLLILDSDGKLVSKQVGAVKGPQLIKFGEQALAKKS